MKHADFSNSEKLIYGVSAFLQFFCSEDSDWFVFAGVYGVFLQATFPRVMDRDRYIQLFVFFVARNSVNNFIDMKTNVLLSIINS